MRTRARAHGHNLPKMDQHLTAVFVVLYVNVLTSVIFFYTASRMYLLHSPLPFLPLSARGLTAVCYCCSLFVPFLLYTCFVW